MKRNGPMLFLFTMLVLGVTVPQSVNAQWNYQVDVDATYDGNPLGLKGASAGSSLSASAGAEYFGSRAGGGYAARITGYDQPTELSSYYHRGFFTFGSQKTNVHLLGEQRLGTVSSLYDYLVLKWNFGHQFRCLGFRCGITATGSLFRFSELTERNQGAVVAALRISRSFQTRTSIIASAGTGYTYYTDLPLPSEAETPEVADQDQDVSQVTLSLRLAQSLTPTTGAAAFFHQRMIQGATSAVFVDQETGISYALLDDPSLYNSEVLGIELTQILNDYAVSIKVGASYSSRDYPSQGIYASADEYELDTLREDRYTTIWLLARWRVGTGRRNVLIELSGQWSDNTSNSFWYDYSSSYLSLGLGYGL